MSRLFTFVFEFRGTTHVSQVSAPDERDAVLAWAKALRAERPFERASSHLAKAVEADAADLSLAAIRGVGNVWCITTRCGGDLMLANIVETVASTIGS